jgi:hypothetical protein
MRSYVLLILLDQLRHLRLRRGRWLRCCCWLRTALGRCFRLQGNNQPDAGSCRAGWGQQQAPWQHNKTVCTHLRLELLHVHSRLF